MTPCCKMKGVKWQLDVKEEGGVRGQPRVVVPVGTGVAFFKQSLPLPPSSLTSSNIWLSLSSHAFSCMSTPKHNILI